MERTNAVSIPVINVVNKVVKDIENLGRAGVSVGIEVHSHIIFSVFVVFV